MIINILRKLYRRRVDEGPPVFQPAQLGVGDGAPRCSSRRCTSGRSWQAGRSTNGSIIVSGRKAFSNSMARMYIFHALDRSCSLAYNAPRSRWATTEVGATYSIFFKNSLAPVMLPCISAICASKWYGFSASASLVSASRQARIAAS
jgi:hypothetical protein